MVPVPVGRRTGSLTAEERLDVLRADCGLVAIACQQHFRDEAQHRHTQEIVQAPLARHTSIGPRAATGFDGLIIYGFLIAH